MIRVTSTDFARNLSDLLNRVKYRRDRFEIVRGGEVVAMVLPSESAATVEQLVSLLARLGSAPRGLADDLERIQAEQPKLEAPAWDA
jgi:hypothetical protein